MITGLAGVEILADKRPLGTSSRLEFPKGMHTVERIQGYDIDHLKQPIS